MIDIELIIGNLGYVLDEGEIDEKSRKLIYEAYREALKGNKHSAEDSTE